MYFILKLRDVGQMVDHEVVSSIPASDTIKRRKTKIGPKDGGS